MWPDWIGCSLRCCYISIFPESLPRPLHSKHRLNGSRRIPIDVELLTRLRNRWEQIEQELVTRVDAQYGVYEGTSFRNSRFERWLAEHGILWPRYANGELMLKRKCSEIWPVFIGTQSVTRIALLAFPAAIERSDGRSGRIQPLYAFALRSSVRRVIHLQTANSFRSERLSYAV